MVLADGREEPARVRSSWMRRTFSTSTVGQDARRGGGTTLDAELFDLPRDHRRRPADGHLRAHGQEAVDVRAGDTAVGDVAEDADVQPFEATRQRSRIVYMSSSACVGCSCAPSPALMTFAFDAPCER